MIASRERLLVALVANGGLRIPAKAEHAGQFIEAAQALADAACAAWGHAYSGSYEDGDPAGACSRCGGARR